MNRPLRMFMVFALLLPVAAGAEVAPRQPPSGGAPANARIAVPPPGATAASRHEAVALADVAGIRDQIEQALGQLRTDLIRAAMQHSGLAPDDGARIVDEVLMPEFAARRDEVEALMVEPWAANFSPADLRLLRAFFASPLGRRYLRAQPAIAAQTQLVWREWSQRVFRESIDRRAAELRARGLNF